MEFSTTGAKDALENEQAAGEPIAGRPVYLFQQDGVIDAWYNGQAIPPGQDQVPQDGCCSGAAPNPQMHVGMAPFCGVRGQPWYYTSRSAPRRS
ncbi:MAG: hypothetical protein JXB85_10485 [Anaerolineales bacterium]|nr:hypothetical protein [Anaerolineales bacterium]